MSDFHFDKIANSYLPQEIKAQKLIKNFDASYSLKQTPIKRFASNFTNG